MQNDSAFPSSRCFPPFFLGVFLACQKVVKTLGVAATRLPHEQELLPPHTRVALPDVEGSFVVVDVEGGSFSDYASKLSALIVQALLDRDIIAPLVALQEIVDNLVHALPCSVSVVLDPQHKNLFISDTGPGIHRLDLAFDLGYSTARELHRSYIRGVGIGLFLAREDLRSLGGELRLESDPGRGTYAHLAFSAAPPSPGWAGGAGAFHLTQRQNNILFLLSEGESLGPSQVSSELNTGVSTAHRDLIKLQDLGLIYSNSSGKRFLSELGRSYLQSLLSL
ncbi:MAG: ATP-binding protein [Actinobacteria bacterium]|nr:MAG: ATP-binding protein [Actinomycetota bacterium]